MSPLPFQKILVPIDFSKYSHEVFNLARELALVANGKLLLLHVVERPDARHSSEYIVTFMQEMVKQAEEELVEYGQGPMGNLIESRTVVEGVPFFEILRAAHEQEADIIVMGTHGRTGLAHLLIGSTAEKVVRKAACPVLTVKGKDFKFEMPFGE